MAGEEQVGNIVYQVQMDVANLIEAQRKVNERLEKMSGGASKAASKFDQLQTSINKVAGAIAASIVVDWGRAFLVAADNMSQLNARIERLTGSAATASQTMQSLMRISSATGGSLQDTAKLWETLSTALRDTGATNGQIIQLTETLQKIGRIGGSSSEEMANALRQFGQSISSGTIRAEEFNSILEQMPELARQIAAGMGVSIGELRQLMLDGKLTAEDALNAIQKQTDSVNAEFEKLPRTLSQANTALTNSFLTMVDNINQATGASNGMVLVIDSLAVAIGRLTGQAATASQQIADLRSEAEMYAKRARTWSWLGFGDWQKENEEKSAQLTAEAWEKASRAGWDAVQKTAAATKPIEIKATATTGGSKAKGGKSAAQKEAEQYAKAQESINEKLEAMRQESVLAAGSTSELTREQQLLRAEMSLGADATDEQRQKAREYKAQALDTAEALKKQAQAERDKQAAQSNFSSLQSQASPVASVESQFQQQIEQLNQYAALYPQKIAEVEAVRASIEEQYRQKRLDAQWQELSQMNIGFGMLTSAVDAFGGNASNVITGLITGTMSAQDAMRSLGNTMLNSVVNALVQVGVEALKNFIIGQTLGAASTAASVGMATTTAAAWAPAAALASLASFGANSAPAMAGIASTVGLAQGLALAGARYNGGPVSAGSMYQVGERGKPEIYQASTGKQYMIPGDNGRVISNKEMTAGGGGGVVINIQNYTSSSVDAQAGKDANGGVTVDVIVADLNNGGPISNAITSNMNVKRTPRGQG
ncbi:tape measure protein [Enterobacter hormaechei]|jgi:tape measure domain-containing protein|uniref:tape measure protein n=5 Tax=Enterobacter hormaechei TaxID=158836 RepID=UPI000797C7E4|nr:tape measure protein [Enterobacter hormaechei]MCU2467238.1 tape measure protein [Enterobacter hormaechei subsp. steigerwaltii]ELW9521050.1 tape measure protein [Enterobacter hormaechei]MBA2803085.1 tape measure protein [Enterobacter hormaechei]MBJ6439416.1 tape measure protein [Enterobacter hormaechei]MBK4406807.1 tape measure protein [Enterobacter hormaechei]